MAPRKKRHSAKNLASNLPRARKTSSQQKNSISSRTKTSKNGKSERKKKISIGKRQSPIDIRCEIIQHDARKCQKDSLRLNYSPGDCCELTADSSGFRVDVSPNCSTNLRARHLPGRYQLAQFHAHWGQDASCGSEHHLDGMAMSGEVHFVFWNTKYRNLERAMEYGEGLAVLGVFLKEGEESSNYQLLFDLVQEANESRKAAPVPVTFDLEQLLPAAENRDFVTYPGSLTTPSYSECVIWTVLLEPVEVSKKQLDVLRAVTPANYRECQDLCHRKVLSSTAVISR